MGQRPRDNRVSVFFKIHLGRVNTTETPLALQPRARRFRARAACIERNPTLHWTPTAYGVQAHYRGNEAQGQNRRRGADVGHRVTGGSSGLSWYVLIPSMAGEWQLSEGREAYSYQQLRGWG